MAMEAGEGGEGDEKRSVRLFGVTIRRGVAEEEEEEVVVVVETGVMGEEVMRKSLSMGNLSTAAHGAGGEQGYLSDGGLAKSGLRQRGAHNERKKGVPWTKEEHRTFLAGLEKLGKGDWRGISRKFVTTRTPTQVASHAQKYFIRQTIPTNKRRRSSLFDVLVNDTVQASTSETTSTNPLAKTNELANDIKPVFQDNEKGEISELDSTQTVPKDPEIRPSLQHVANPSPVSEPCSLSNMEGVSGFMQDEKLMSVEPYTSPTLPLMFYLPHSTEAVSCKVNPHPTSFNLEFPPLFPCRPSQESAANEKNDLELSIAPPKVLSMNNVAASEWSWCH